MTLDPSDLRRAFGRFMTGVTVVTTRGPAGELFGFTANSFTSVSLDPPLLLVCPGKHLSSFEAFRTAPGFGISVLAEGQEMVSNLFASGKSDRFAACDWDAADSGMPLISGRSAGFVCDTHQVVEAGDHIVLIGQVRTFDDAGRAGLGYGAEGYFTRLQDRAAGPDQPGPTRVSALLEDGKNLFLSADFSLPTVPVSATDSPLSALRAGLAAQGIEADLSVVYAVYDEAGPVRRIVFRGYVTAPPPGLTACPIEKLETLPVPDRAFQALLTRFSQEHRLQDFGLYIGNELHGDVVPDNRRM
jgi:flavin-dependent trigonelline monooxygenase, reductase component